MDRRATDRPAVTMGWLAVGALLAFGLAATFTPFLLLAFPALCLGVVLGVRTGFGRRAWAALAGAAWVPLWIGWQDRGGPGDVCRYGRDGSAECVSAGDPWPWLGVGLLMVALGLGLALRTRRQALGPSTSSGRVDQKA